ncbi:MAG TPA: hypothetical protein DCY94_04910 [Firmicutes bacterium]|nr:hypothetical protein [Bacillota bacterium]
MIHIVYCDDKSKELKKILDGKKTMLLRGADSRKVPHSRVFLDDELYFIEKGTNFITAKALVSNVENYVKLSDADITKTIEANDDKLLLSPEQIKKWHKRCLCLVSFREIEAIEPIEFENKRMMEDWLIFEDIVSINN